MKNIKVEARHKGNGNERMEARFKILFRQLEETIEPWQAENMKATVSMVMISNDDGADIVIRIDCDNKNFKKVLQDITNQYVGENQFSN